MADASVSSLDGNGAVSGDLLLALADRMADRLAEQFAARLAEALARRIGDERAAAGRHDPEADPSYDTTAYTSYYTRAYRSEDQSPDTSSDPSVDRSAHTLGDGTHDKSSHRYRTPAGEPGPEPPAARRDVLWTARRVAAHYGVTPRFVYEHADELGCLRLGAGPRPRLRFDPRTVRERWSHLRAPKPVAPQRSQPAGRPRGRPPKHGAPEVELLDFDRDP
jgi:hypothetical protein